jgi:hypothetical protein
MPRDKSRSTQATENVKVLLTFVGSHDPIPNAAAADAWLSKYAGRFIPGWVGRIAEILEADTP